MTCNYVEEREREFREALKDGNNNKCNCARCRTKRGEKITLSGIRHGAVSEMRKALNKILKKYNHGVDGWAFAVSCLEDSRGSGLAVNRFAMINRSKPGIECAAHLAAQAVSEIMDADGCNQEDAEKIFRGRMLEALHPTLSKKEMNKMPDLLKGLMGLDALLGGPQGKKPEEKKPEETPKETIPVNTIVQ